MWRAGRRSTSWMPRARFATRTCGARRWTRPLTPCWKKWKNSPTSEAQAAGAVLVPTGGTAAFLAPAGAAQDASGKKAEEMLWVLTAGPGRPRPARLRLTAQTGRIEQERRQANQ